MDTYIFLVMEHGDVDPDEVHKRRIPILQTSKANRGLMQLTTPHRKKQREYYGKQSSGLLVIRTGWTETEAHPKFSSQTRHIEPIEQSEFDNLMGEEGYLIPNGKHVVVHPQALYGSQKQLCDFQR